MSNFIVHASARVAANGSTFARLTPADRRVALSAALHLVRYWLLLRWSGTRKLLARRRSRNALGRRQRDDVNTARNTSRASAGDGTDVERLCAQVDAVAKRLGLPSTCLTRALVVRHLLERRGVFADVRIGVALERSRLSAHAWIEHCGRPVYGRMHVGYTPFEPQRLAASPARDQ